MSNRDLRAALAQTIIKSPEAARMLRMVTAGFYDASRLALWMFEVIGREYDGMAGWAREVKREARPQTCTWSIAIWEFLYGIEPDESLTLEQRRHMVLFKILARPPVNPARIESILEAQTGCPAHVFENAAPHMFRAEIFIGGNQGVDQDGVVKAIRKNKPSHMSFEVVYQVAAECRVYSAVDVNCIYISMVVEVAAYGLA